MWSRRHGRFQASSRVLLDRMGVDYLQVLVNTPFSVLCSRSVLHSPRQVQTCRTLCTQRLLENFLLVQCGRTNRSKPTYRAWRASFGRRNSTWGFPKVSSSSSWGTSPYHGYLTIWRFFWMFVNRQSVFHSFRLARARYLPHSSASCLPEPLNSLFYVQCTERSRCHSQWTTSRPATEIWTPYTTPCRWGSSVDLTIRCSVSGKNWVWRDSLRLRRLISTTPWNVKM